MAKKQEEESRDYVADAVWRDKDVVELIPDAWIPKVSTTWQVTKIKRKKVVLKQRPTSRKRPRKAILMPTKRWYTVIVERSKNEEEDVSNDVWLDLREQLCTDVSQLPQNELKHVMDLVRDKDRGEITATRDIVTLDFDNMDVALLEEIERFVQRCSHDNRINFMSLEDRINILVKVTSLTGRRQVILLDRIKRVGITMASLKDFNTAAPSTLLKLKDIISHF